MSIISVQSHVSFGHVGNSAAQFAMQYLGHEVWPVHTVHLAHHPGHGGFHGSVSKPESISEMFDGLKQVGAFADCQALLSGYMGAVEIGDATIAAWNHLKAAAPAAIYGCATVIGDAQEGVYVDAALPGFFKTTAVPQADWVIANAFEAGLLTGDEVTDSDSARRAAQTLMTSGPSQVVVTSVPGGDRVGNLLAVGGRTWAAFATRHPNEVKGAGDFMAAVYMAKLIELRDPPAAFQFAVSATALLVEAAQSDPNGEMPLVTAADQWVSPAPGVEIYEIG